MTGDRLQLTGDYCKTTTTKTTTKKTNKTFFFFCEGVGVFIDFFRISLVTMLSSAHFERCSGLLYEGFGLLQLFIQLYLYETMKNWC